MNRERIELDEHTCRTLIDQNYRLGDVVQDVGFEIIESEVEYRDLEKGYEEFECIIKRTLDNKYFRFNYIESPYSSLFEDETFPIIAWEAFPKVIKTTIYE